MSFFKKLLYKEQANNIKINSNKDNVVDNWLVPQTGKELLATPYRQKLLHIIYQQTKLNQTEFDRIYGDSFERFANLVQLLPASEYHHHSEHGGLLEHTLETVGFAVKIRHQYMLPLDSSPEEQIKVGDIWTGVVVFTALLHDVGKIFADINIELKTGQIWHPWDGFIKDLYRFKYFTTDKDYEFHTTLGPIFLQQIASPIILNWLYSQRKAYMAMMYAISGHYEKAGIIGTIIGQADRASVSYNLGGDTSKLENKPKASLPKQIIMALRQITTRELKLNNPSGGSDGWVTEDALWVMSKTLADKIRASLSQEGITAVPNDNISLFNELQAYGIVAANNEGKAVWKCKIYSDNDWVSPEYSLLKIPHAMAWPSIEKKPANFSGKLEVVNANTSKSGKEKDPLSKVTKKTSAKNSIIENNDTNVEISSNNNRKDAERAIQITNVEQPKNLDTGDTNDDFSFALNLFDTSPTTIDNPDKADNLDSNLAENSPTSIDSSQIDIKTDDLSLNHDGRTEVIKDSPAYSNESNIEHTHNSNKTDEGKVFLNWVRDNIKSGHIKVNRNDAAIHIVDNKVFLITPKIFQLYVRNKSGNTNKEEWLKIQKSFQALGVHEKRHTKEDSYNIWECDVTGPRKSTRLKGFLIPNISLLFTSEDITFNNLYLTLMKE